ncbi:hypothetical protein C7C46_21365 [Streptomyces tateyamensis]|uniref:Uncharacterized protein n=1 Tax=Streptomyces tateyamensis TaxID=565073 RepID=A0A2V4NLN6_9ACTN|nr:hypothetical protein [Streptomyces tateyamensis]PYC76741.1 hypothetical protein C7C46_21365 [Streptomyces tateyamensis]
MRFHRGGRERGTISIFVAISASMMLAFAGIVVDAGGQLRTIELADSLAQEAARAGGQEIDQNSLLSGTGYRIDQQAGCAAAKAYLTSDQRLQNVNLKIDCRSLNEPAATSTSISIAISMDYRTALLSLFNISTLSVQGYGTAKLATDPTKPGGP